MAFFILASCSLLGSLPCYALIHYNNNNINNHVCQGFNVDSGYNINCLVVILTLLQMATVFVDYQSQMHMKMSSMTGARCADQWLKPVPIYPLT